jgi:hypothetical protein
MYLAGYRSAAGVRRALPESAEHAARRTVAAADTATTRDSRWAASAVCSVDLVNLLR